MVEVRHASGSTRCSLFACIRTTERRLALFLTPNHVVPLPPPGVQTGIILHCIGSYWLEGRQLRSNFGTTKYCATYLRNSPCSNPDCLYLHELGDEDDRFTKEEIQQRSLLAPPIPPGAVTVTGGGGPSGTGMRCTSPYLPPPVYQSAESGSSSREGGGGRVVRSLSQGQQATVASGAATAAQRAATRGAKPAGQVTCCCLPNFSCWFDCCLPNFSARTEPTWLLRATDGVPLAGYLSLHDGA